MTREELNSLIDQWENAKVDFKRELWNIKDLDNIEDKNEKKKIQEEITLKKNELLKDIFSLTNGDIYSTKKTAYLIIGVDDKTKEICKFDINNLAKDYSLEKFKKELLQWLNNYAQPEFLALDMEFVDEVLVISIPPRGSLISLSKDLKLKNKRGEYVDKKGTTYYRVGEDIRVASSEVVGEFEKVFGSDIEKYNNALPKPIEVSPKINNIFFYSVLTLIILGSIFFMIKDNSSQEVTVKGDSNKITQTIENTTTGSQKIDVEGSGNELNQTKNNFDTKEICQDAISQYQKNIDELTKELHNTKDEKTKITITKKLKESKDNMKNLITDCTK